MNAESHSDICTDIFCPLGLVILLTLYLDYAYIHSYTSELPNIYFQGGAEIGNNKLKVIGFKFHFEELKETVSRRLGRWLRRRFLTALLMFIQVSLLKYI